MAFDPKYIRNFSIVAHIDHGKSTLADQLLLQSGAITQREFREQLLDDMDLERERGITIKARAVAINYTLDGQVYELNLIDTPGHVDFHYEVSRSLAACEGAILLVDATQGVQAQTVANAYLAVGNDLAIVPVLNKIDMQAARPEEVKEEILHTLGIDPAEVLAISAKTGQGVPDVFRAIIERGSAPGRRPDRAAAGLDFRLQVRRLPGGDHVRSRRGRHAAGRAEDPADGRRDGTRGHGPGSVPASRGALRRARGWPGRLRDRQYQEAVGRANRRHDHPGSGSCRRSLCRATRSRCRSSSAASFQPRTTSSTTSAPRSKSWRSTIPASRSSPETSDALGFGFRCGFLGMLHMEIVQQRLERESNLSLVQTAPNVTYEILTRKGETLHISNPTRIPDPGEIEEFREPIAKVNFIIPADSIGAIMQLCEDRRGDFIKTEYLSPTRAILTYELPLAEMIYDLYDKLKSATRGYGTMDYDLIGYRAGDLCRLDILVAGQKRRRPLGGRPPRPCRPPGPETGPEVEGGDRPAPVRGGDPGGHRQPGDRPRDDLGLAQERHRQVLRRRHYAENENFSKSKKRARSV